MVTAVGGEVVISDDIEVDDYEVTSKTDRKGVVTKKKTPYQGTLKSLLRKLRMTLPVTRFLALEDDAREFLLYAIINAHWKRGGTLVIPDYLKRKSLAADEYQQYGQELASRRPPRFGAAGLSPTTMVQVRGLKKPRPDTTMEVDAQDTSHGGG